MGTNSFCVLFVLCGMWLNVCQSAILLEGDMLVKSNIPTVSVLAIDEASVRPKRSARRTKERNYTWDYGIVPYKFNESAKFNFIQIAEIKKAMNHWEAETCIKFVEYNEADFVNFILFTKLACGCCSYVGMQNGGGQHVSIGDGCDRFGIIVHELGHAIGFFHEHTRPDRDEYVQILSNNISPGEEPNFNKVSPEEVDTLDEPYDHDSIMHYSRFTFSKDSHSLSTILPKKWKNGTEPEIGQRERLSQIDIKKAKKLYKCPECGRKYFEQAASFTSPGYHNKSTLNRSDRCEWLISVTHGERIELNITDLDIFKSIDCKSDYLEIRDGYWHKSPLLGRFCGKNIPKLIMSTGNRMVINYVSTKRDGLNRGFAAEYKAICGGDLTIDNQFRIESPKFPYASDRNTECIWRVSVPSKSRIVLEFNLLELGCSIGFVEVREGYTSVSPLLGGKLFCGSSSRQIVTSESNQLYIRFVSGESSAGGGFSATLHRDIDECAQKNHGCEHNCVNNPSGYHCSCRLGSKLRDDGKTCEVTCGGIIETTNGVIQSPLYPNAYAANQECIWEITAQIHHRITLNFTHFDLEGNQGECAYDTLTLFSLSNGTQDETNVAANIFCGSLSTVPPIFVSKTNKMRIIFKSDASVQKTGFSAVFTTSIDRCAIQNGGCQHICKNTIKSIQCSCKRGFMLDTNGFDCVKELHACHHEVTSPAGLITSDNYPNDYGKNINCTWHFKGLNGHRPYLEFPKFELEYSYGCMNDAVEVYIRVARAKRTITGSETYTIGKFCGSINDENVLDTANAVVPVSSPADDLYMSFRTDSFNEKSGFVMKHTTKCGGHFTATNTMKYISSHAQFGDDTTYDDHTDCDWIIGAPLHKRSKQRIHLKFQEFDLEPAQKCKFDFVELFEKRFSEWVLYGRYCGSNVNVEVVATTKLLLRFRTNGSVGRRGFLASYSLADEETLKVYDSRKSKRFTRLKPYAPRLRTSEFQ